MSLTQEDTYESCIICCGFKPAVKYDTALNGFICSDCQPHVDAAEKAIQGTNKL